MDRLYSAIQVPHMERNYDNIRIMALLLWLLSVSSMVAHAQKTLVCDAATHFPIRDVLVKVDGRNLGMTTWQGLINLPDTFQTATFSKKGYVPEKLFRAEILRDTVFLYPAEHYLDEVIVTGRQTTDGRALLEKMPKRDILEKRPKCKRSEFDIGLMLDRRYRRDKQHVEQLRKIFKKMDGVEDHEDPILKAYRQTLLDQRNDSIKQSMQRKEGKSEPPK